jgi:uncharacterized protein
MNKYFLTLVAVVLLVGCKRQAPTLDIWTAAATGNLPVIKEHLAYGTDLNGAEPVGGGTPLIAAALTGQTEIAGLLIAKGARVDAQNHDGATALMVAAFFGYPETVKLLLDKGADVNQANNNGDTPLDAVGGDWNPQLESIYQSLAQSLRLPLDLDRIKAARPQVADLLQRKGGRRNKS